MRKNLEQLSADVRASTNREWRASKWGSRLTSGGALRLSDNALVIADRNARQDVPYLTIKSVEGKKGLVWSSIKVHTEQKESPIKVTGLKHQHVAEAVQAVEQFWALSNVHALKKHLPRANEIEKRISHVLDKRFWLTKSQVSGLSDFVRSQAEDAVPDWPRHARSAGALTYFSDDEAQTFELVLDPLSTIERRATTHNETFLRDELTRKERFFDTIEKNPLTGEQRVAAITFDDNVLAIAAAGSGKTSTLVAKAGYAVQAEIAKPEEILLLAFNKDAAEELRERVQTYLSKHISNASDITVSTFHSFGLSVIGEATGKKPRVAPWIDQNKDIQVLAEIVEELKADPAFKRNWSLFRYVFGRSLPEIGAKEEPEWWDPESKSRGFMTLRGETVKSKEELMIANWLAISGINYEYEAKYQHETATAQYSQYHPDFFYPVAQLYHEHFALDEFGNAPSSFGSYEDGVEWKRQLHEAHGTPFIETTSYGIRQADGFENLEKQLKSHGVTFGELPLPEQDQEEVGDEVSLISLVRTFLIHVKSNHIEMADLQARSQQRRLGSRSHAGREQTFLNLFEKIWQRWDEMLTDGNYVDFEDMLSKAASHLADGSYKSPYKLVMADEFQDTSVVRGKMLQGLKKPPGTRLFVVGDDWQAINRFAGADISLMNGFESYFGSNTIVKLTKTFRCPQKLSDLAASFVSKNPGQIDKTVATVNPRTEESILCYAINNQGDASAVVEKHIRQLYQKAQPPKPNRLSVMVMGRYWSDKPRNLSKWAAEFEDKLDIVFSTVHGSKGLEADYVFLTNLTRGRKGFPSEIEDDPLLQLAMPTGEDYPYAEERRLFYVALTRAKQMIILYTQAQRESEFLIELQKDGLIKIRGEDGVQSVEACPECQRGSIVVKRSKYGEFLGCSRFPRCTYKRNI